MALCDWCEHEMTADTVKTCTGNETVYFSGSESLPSLPYTGPGKRCHDCNVARGGKHHPGCDMERCPKCGGQLISCGCLDEDDGDDYEDDNGLNGL
jgi:hypothetical protein